MITFKFIRIIRVFLITFFLTFLMSVIPHLLPNHVLFTPLPKKVDPLERVRVKLQGLYNNFQLQIVAAFPQDFGNSNNLLEQASAYGAMDFDNGQVLFSKNLNLKLPIASLTKIMTAVVALDLASPDVRFPVSERAAAQLPTKVMLKPGENYPLEELLKFALITSANDSVEVIKEGINAKYDSDIFVQSMNIKAQVIGLHDTHFANAEGYDNEGNFSSVGDLMLLAHYAIEHYPLIAQIVREDHEDLTNNGSDLRFYLNNWNGLLGVYPGVLGIKIGNTEKGGYTSVVLSERENKKVLAVVLGAPGVLERDLSAAELLDLGFNKLQGLSPIGLTEDQLKQKYASWKYF